MDQNDNRRGKHPESHSRQTPATPNMGGVPDYSEERAEQPETRMTVHQFAAQVTEWIVDCADEDDIQQFVAEFKGVPLHYVLVTGDDITVVPA